MATFVLAVSIGINLVVFTLVNALWIRPLAFPDPEQVVTIIPELGHVRLNSPDLTIFHGAVAGQVITSGPNEALRPRVEIAGAGQQLETLGVTSRYFKVLEARIRGRGFRSRSSTAYANSHRPRR